jgi:hypothetical protein
MIAYIAAETNFKTFALRLAAAITTITERNPVGWDLSQSHA